MCQSYIIASQRCEDFRQNEYLCLICACTDCNCDQRGTVPNTQCDPVSQACQCKVCQLLRL